MGILKTFVPRSTILKNAGAPEIWVAVDDLERFGVPAQEAAWHVEVGNRISIPIHTLMTRMSRLDPTKSISLTEALREYTEILTAVRELYTPVKVYKGLKAIDEYNELASPLAGLSPKRSSPKAAAAASIAKAATPKPTAPTTTRKLKLNEANQKALAKKKRAVEKARKAAKEEIEEAQEELSDARKKHRELEDKLDKAKRDKMAAKVITDFEKALAKYTTIIQKAVVNLEDVREEAQDAINEAQAAYMAFREGLPRRTAST
jgi:DNA repair exonuclease SbcCD ATPase subunit